MHCTVPPPTNACSSRTMREHGRPADSETSALIWTHVLAASLTGNDFRNNALQYTYEFTRHPVCECRDMHLRERENLFFRWFISALKISQSEYVSLIQSKTRYKLRFSVSVTFFVFFSFASNIEARIKNFLSLVDTVSYPFSVLKERPVSSTPTPNQHPPFYSIHLKNLWLTSDF